LCSLRSHVRNSARVLFARATARASFICGFIQSNFYYRREEQLATLAWFLEQAADQASRGDLEILTMGECARRLAEVPVPSGRVLQ
jgi:hypothetical protein